MFNQDQGLLFRNFWMVISSVSEGCGSGLFWAITLWPVPLSKRFYFNLDLIVGSA